MSFALHLPESSVSGRDSFKIFKGGGFVLFALPCNTAHAQCSLNPHMLDANIVPLQVLLNPNHGPLAWASASNLEMYKNQTSAYMLKPRQYMTKG